jgi:hypothetical protein
LIGNEKGEACTERIDDRTEKVSAGKRRDDGVMRLSVLSKMDQLVKDDCGAAEADSERERETRKK